MRALLALATAAALHTPLAAAADEPLPNRIRIARPEVHASVGGHVDIGAGVRLDFPIIRSGLLESDLDEIALSLAFDVQGYDFLKSGDDTDDVLLMPGAAVEWSFYPGGRASFFTELGFAVVIADDDHFYHEDTPDRDAHTDLLVGGGLRIHSGSRLAFVARVGWPTGLQLGLAF